MDQHTSDWFRGEYQDAVDQGKKGDALRLAMYEMDLGT